LHTLADARAYILSLPSGTRHQDDWQRAADLLMAAIDSASETDIEQAMFQIERARLSVLFDYVVGADKQNWRHGQAKCLRDLEVDDQIELGWLLDGQPVAVVANRRGHD
jgi:hypothetical protein